MDLVCVFLGESSLILAFKMLALSFGALKMNALNSSVVSAATQVGAINQGY